MLKLEKYSRPTRIAAVMAVVMALPSISYCAPGAPTPVVRPQSPPLDPAVRQATRNRLAEIQAYQWTEYSDARWLELATELQQLTIKLEPSIPHGTKEDRALAFLLLFELGRCAENANISTPPFYAMVKGRAVNYGWYLAGRMATPELMQSVTPENRPNIQHYIDTLPSLCDDDADQRFDLDVALSVWTGGVGNVDLLVDGAVAIENVAVGCASLGKIVLEVPLAEGQALQRQVWEAKTVVIRAH